MDSKLPEYCSFCEEPLIDDKTGERIPYVENGYTEDGEAKILCLRCVKKSYKIMGGKIDNANEPGKAPVANIAGKSLVKVELPKSFKVLKPKEMYSELRKYVVGQESYLRDLSMWQYNHCRRLQLVVEGVPEDRLPKRISLLVLGPTGVGKTHSITTMAKIIGLPIVIADVTGMTEAGYVGGDVEDTLKKLLVQCGGSVELMQTSIVVFDEADKLAAKAVSWKDVSGEGVQQAILKLAGGSDLSTITISASSSKYQAVKRDECEVSTLHMGFVAMGAFSGLKSLQRERSGGSRLGFRATGCSETEKDDVAYKLVDDHELTQDLVKYGLLPEFLGRFSYKTILDPLSVAELEAILTVPEDSVIRTEAERFMHEGIELKVTEAAIHKLAEDAHKMKLGARTIASSFARLTRDVGFEAFGSGDGGIVEVYVNGNGNLAVRKEKKIVKVS